MPCWRLISGPEVGGPACEGMRPTEAEELRRQSFRLFAASPNQESHGVTIPPSYGTPSFIFIEITLIIYPIYYEYWVVLFTT